MLGCRRVRKSARADVLRSRKNRVGSIWNATAIVQPRDRRDLFDSFLEPSSGLIDDGVHTFYRIIPEAEQVPPLHSGDFTAKERGHSVVKEEIQTDIGLNERIQGLVSALDVAGPSWAEAFPRCGIVVPLASGIESHGREGEQRDNLQRKNGLFSLLAIGL